MAETTGIGGGSNEATILATFKDQTADGVDKLRKRLGGVRDDADKASKAVAGVGSNGPGKLEETYRVLGNVAKGATLTVVALGVLKPIVTGIGAAMKLMQGDTQGAVRGLKDLDNQLSDLIRSVPIAGQALDGLARSIYDVYTGGALAKAEKSAAEATDAAAKRGVIAAREIAALGEAEAVRARGFNEDLAKRVELTKEIEKLEQQLATSGLARDRAGNLTEAGKDIRSAVNQAKKELAAIDAAHDKLRSDRLEDIAAARATLSGSNPNAQGDLDFARQQKQDSKDYLQAHGANGGFEEFQQLQQIKKAQHDVEDAVAKRTEAESKLGQKLADNANLAQSGSISIFEADRRNAAAQKEYERAIEQTRAELVKLRDAATDPAIQQGIQKQIDALPPHVTAIRKELNKLGGEIRDSLQQPVEGFFKGILTGSVSAKQAFKNMVAGFADNLATLAANKLASGLLSSIFGGGAGSGAGGGLGGLIGGLLAGSTAKNSGGWIPGSGPDRDSVLMAGTPGEYVVRRRAAQAAPRLLEAVNSGRISDRMLGLASSGMGHYNVGGFVQPMGGGAGGGGGGGAHTITPMLVATPNEARKIVNAGEDAIFDLLNRYPERMPRSNG